MIESITLLKELGLPTIGIVGMLIIYVVSIKKISRKVDTLEQNFSKFSFDVEQSVNKLALDVLQLKITNKQLPDYARIAAYDEYKRKGGNSWIDGYVKEQGLLLK
jgi:hypothetical protein